MALRRPRVIALVGLRAVGKTTLGRCLAQQLGWSFVDGDELIAAQVGMSAGQFLRERGEAAFRAMEVAVYPPCLAASQQVVLATGGGVVVSAELRAALRQPGVLVVWLQATAAACWQRSRCSGLDRPALTQESEAREFATLLARRAAWYHEVADATLCTDGRTVAALAGPLQQLLAPFLSPQADG